jgi:hypothetical protein
MEAGICQVSGRVRTAPSRHDDDILVPRPPVYHIRREDIERMRGNLVWVSRIALGFWLAACSQLVANAYAATAPRMSPADTMRLAQRIIPAKNDPDGWGKDIWEALASNGIATKRSNICAVMAVIEQESTFTANPEVSGLGSMAENEITDKLSTIPMLPLTATQGVKWFLANRPTPEKSYIKLIRAARTERDLDLVFRNMAFYLFREYASTAILNAPPVARRVDGVNPVSTLGSMQVSVRFALNEIERVKGRRLEMNGIWKLRDELYTRQGGVNYGARMLLGYYAGYQSRLHVFADFNAGRYASRNAAFQHMAATLGARKLALDGDLLIYERGIATSAVSATETVIRHLNLGLKDEMLRADLLKEKTYAFRDTETYRRLAGRYARKTGKPAPYAMVPQIRLDSPKLSRSMTTERFAKAVMRRYEKCLKVR